LIVQEFKNTFPKAEHLCGKIAIDKLYAEGKIFLSYPVRVVFRASPKDEIPARCLINAPKKKFKLATDRNRIKRQIREAYRKNKHDLYRSLEEKDYQLHLAINYIGDKIESSGFVEKKVKAALAKLVEQLP
jgi:ribonuclease P protein component